MLKVGEVGLVFRGARTSVISYILLWQLPSRYNSLAPITLSALREIQEEGGIGCGIRMYYNSLTMPDSREPDKMSDFSVST